MLTGDRRATAEAVGAELGLDKVRAGLSPAQKVESVTALKDGGGSHFKGVRRAISKGSGREI